MTDETSRQLAFATRYAGFLVASHASFSQNPARLPGPAYRMAIRLGYKPWREVLKDALACSEHPSGVILEFGVFKGHSIRYLAAQRPKSRLHGFDSFKGFPSDARKDWQQDFSVDRIPTVPANVNLHPGFFEETLPAFIADWEVNRPEIALVHIDCDIFSSTHTALSMLAPHLRASDVIVFDELMNYRRFVSNEFLALYLLLCRTGLDFEWAATQGRAYPFAEQDGKMPTATFKEYRVAGHFQNQAIRLCERAGGGHFGGVASEAVVTNVYRALGAFFESPAWSEGAAATVVAAPDTLAGATQKSLASALDHIARPA